MKSPGQDAAGECQYKSFNDEEMQVGVVEFGGKSTDGNRP